MKLVELLWADIFRDGGSYGAEFLTDEDLSYSLFLQRSRMPDEKGLHHRWLYEYRGSEKPENCIPVITGSIEEQQIISRLESFLKANPNPDDDSQPGSNQYWLERLEELLHYVSLREPCFANDVRANFSKRA